MAFTWISQYICMLRTCTVYDEHTNTQWLLLTTEKSTLQVDKLNGNNIFRLFIWCNGSRHCGKPKRNRDGCTHFADSYMILNMDMKCANIWTVVDLDLCLCNLFHSKIQPPSKHFEYIRSIVVWLVRCKKVSMRMAFNAENVETSSSKLRWVWVHILNESG